MATDTEANEDSQRLPLEERGQRSGKPFGPQLRSLSRWLRDHWHSNSTDTDDSG